MTESQDLRIAEREGAIRFDVLVSPRASRDRVGPVHGELVKISVTAPPVEDSANEAVVALLARALGVRQKDVRIVSGRKGKRKTVEVQGASAQSLRVLVGRSE